MLMYSFRILIVPWPPRRSLIYFPGDSSCARSKILVQIAYMDRCPSMTAICRQWKAVNIVYDITTTRRVKDHEDLRITSSG